RRPQLVLREIRIEEQPVVPHLVPFTVQPALANAFVEAGARQWIRDGVADVVQRQAAREVDAADQGVGRLADVADHEEPGGLDSRGDARLDGGARLVRRDALLHLLEHAVIAGLDAEEDSLAARAMHLLEESLVNMGDPAQALPCERKTSLFDRLRELEGPLVVEREEVIGHPDDVAALGKRKVCHVLPAKPRGAANHLAVALEHDSRDLLEAPVAEVLHDRDDRLLTLADGHEVELVDEGLRLARGVWAADDDKRL